MGVLFLCDTAEYSCAYGSWNIIRMELLYASIRYLENKIVLHNTQVNSLLDQEHQPPNQIKKKDLIDTREYDEIQKILIKIKKTTDLDDFIDIVSSQGHDIEDFFIQHNLGGLWAIMNKNDDRGCYSPGNALDIVMLFKYVYDFIENKNVQERIPQLKRLFIHSMSSRQFIRII